MAVIIVEVTFLMVQSSSKKLLQQKTFDSVAEDLERICFGEDFWLSGFLKGFGNRAVTFLVINLLLELDDIFKIRLSL